MTVLTVAYPLFPVGPNAGGGAEQILSLLDRVIVSAGHRSIVIAAQGSEVADELIVTPVHLDEITEDARRCAQSAHRHAIAEVLAREQVDVVHFHGLDFDSYMPEVPIPMLATLHLPVSWYQADIFDLPVKMVCVSQSQFATVPGNRELPIVGNGIDIERYHPQEQKSNFLFVLSRICPEKGLEMALRVAHRCDLEMIVAGPVQPFPEHQKYFNERVTPLLDDKRRYVGPVGLKEKTSLLTKAKALINPSSAPETSSLVAMEAFSSATPVIAMRSGALPEIVQHGETGFIVDDEEGMIKALRDLDSISPHYCRTVAERRFDYRRMGAEYIELYGSVLSS